MCGPDYRALLDVVRSTLATDYSCKPDDFLNDEVVIVEAQELDGRRRFPFLAELFNIITMGRGVVVACSADRLAWARKHLGHCTRDELFSISTLARIAGYIAQSDQYLAGPNLSYLCASDTFHAIAPPEGITLELFTQAQMPEVYAFTGFPHALSYRLNHPCPDMIAVVARHCNRVIGLAGVSADSDQLWQIGIDVEAEYRAMGVGKALVSQATEAILAQDKVPYYVTRITNMASSNTARSVGFRLAWTEVHVREL